LNGLFISRLLFFTLRFRFNHEKSLLPCGYSFFYLSSIIVCLVCFNRGSLGRSG
jgi:hypothetical protein